MHNSGYAGSAGPSLAYANSPMREPQTKREYAETASDRPPRVIEAATNDLRRGLDRVNDLTIRVREFANRMTGPIPMPGSPLSAKEANPRTPTEAEALNNAVRDLHHLLDMLVDEVTRLDAI